MSGKFHGVMAATTPSGRRTHLGEGVVVVLDDLARHLEVGEVLEPDAGAEHLDVGLGERLALLGGDQPGQLVGGRPRRPAPARSGVRGTLVPGARRGVGLG